VTVLFVLGPTASGKSALALALAEQSGAEIISVDSQQVYRGMDLGTAKPSAEERRRVPHHLIDIVSPADTMTAQRWADLADLALADCAARGKSAIVCGGTGLYVRALRFGFFAGPEVDVELRARLAAQPLAELHPRLAAVDPVAAARIGANDRQRLVRALEVHELTGRPISEQQAAHDHRKVPARQPGARVIGLAPPRDELVRRIDARVDAMLEAGLIDEVRGLLAAGFAPELRAFGAIGYRQSVELLTGQRELATLAPAIKQATHRYARRQRAWFAAEPDLSWYVSASQAPVAALLEFLARP
jgi:tRNA dimethylallyltransferase